MEKINQKKLCPFSNAMELIGGKWKTVLLYHLMSGKKRYSELQRLAARASDRMLSRSLKELEADGLVLRQVFAEVPVRVEYSLTQDGASLVPILNAMGEWGSNRKHQ